MGRSQIVLEPEARDAAATLGALVRRRRLALPMTVKELAARAGVSARTVTLVERGNPSVSIGNALNVAAVIGVPLFGARDTSTLGLISAAARAEAAAVGRERARKGAPAIADTDVDF